VPVGFVIRAGDVYLYTGAEPVACRGHRYLVAGFVVDVPVYLEKVLVEALSGPDTGLRFTVSPANFATRYVPEVAPAPGPSGRTVPEAPLPERVADFTSRGKY
jgi:hypothetical protein